MQFILFAQDMDMVISSRTEDEKVDKLSISSSDALYGIGFYQYLNDSYSYFPKSVIDEYLFLNYTLLTNRNFSYPTINYETCNAEDFYDPLEWGDFSQSFKNNLVKLIKNYSCPLKNKSLFLEVNNFTQSSSYIQISVRIRPDRFKEAIDFISKHEVFVQIIYSNYFINIKNRFKPFISQIKYTDMSINNLMSKYFLLELSPYQIYDDVSIFPSTEYQLYKNKKLGYDSGSYYSIEEKYSDISGIFFNRTSENLGLINFYVSLSDKSKNIFRDYPKFTTFLAGTNSLILSLYAIFSIVCNFINSTFMNITMTRKRMYSLDISNFCREFIKDEGPLVSKELSFFKRKSDHDIIEISEKKQLDIDFQATNNIYNNKNCICD